MKRLRLSTKCVFVISLLAPAAASLAVEAEFAINLPAVVSLKDRLNTYGEKLPDLDKLAISKVVAYEENELFTYMMGQTSVSLRRIFFIKPATLIVSDVLNKTPDKPATWFLGVDKAPKIDARKISFGEGKTAGFCETILPVETGLSPAKKAVGVTAKHNHSRIFVHVLHLGGGDDKKTPAPVTKLIGAGHIPQLSITLGDASWNIVLPPEQSLAGTVAITNTNAKKSVARRLLPSGILPHGKKNIDMMKRWDKAYRGTGRPGWDAGRVASQLKKAVEEGKVKPGKALVLGCGTGTNAVFLAKKGFEVTGLEVAPTALNIAEAKAREAGVKIRWIVADAANPPHMEPFDFIFDRGCYHHVRWVNLDGYVAAISRLTKPGGQFLLLSFRASGRQGKPRVKESQIRKDFSAAFEFEWLKEMQFDNRRGIGKGSAAWTVLMKRKAPAKPAPTPHHRSLGGP